MRVTRKEVEAVFNHLINCMDEPNRLKYRLDHNAIYGGYQIVKIVNENGGESCPFGYERRSAREMVSAMHFALSTITILKQFQEAK